MPSPFTWDVLAPDGNDLLRDGDDQIRADKVTLAAVLGTLSPSGTPTTGWRQTQIDNDTWLTQNARYDGAAWQRDAVGVDSVAIVLSGQTITYRRVAAAANPITWASFDNIAAHATTHQSGGSDAIKLDDLATPDDNTDLDASSTRHGLLPKLSNTATDVLIGTGSFAVIPLHASRHQSGGADAIKLDDLATPDDNTDLNATTGHHGLLLKLSGSTSEFLRGDGTWSSTSGGTPAAHASTHQSGGSDPIKLDDLAAPDDNTDLNATTSAHGLLLKLGGGTTNFLRADGTWAAPPAGATVDKQIFTASGTWTKPAGVTAALVICIGGGGSGGGGRQAASDGINGGSGGGGGMLAWKLFSASDLGATEAVTVGAQVAGGTTHAAGNAGNPSSFGSHLTAFGGGAGGGGAVTAWSGGGGGGIGGAGGGGASGATSVGGAPQVGNTPNIGVGGGGAGCASAAAGQSAEYGGAAGGGVIISNVGLAGGDSIHGGGGGGGAGSVSVGPVTRAGGAGGGVGQWGSGHGGAGGAAGANGTAGAAGTTLCGQGGGGSGSSTTNGATLVGGAGGAPGGGGGGGGAIDAATGTSTGGVGARGEVRVYSW